MWCDWDNFDLFFTCGSERIVRRVIVLPETQLLERILSRDFGCVHVLSRMKAQVLLNAPDVKKDGVASFKFMDEIFGEF